MGLGVQVGAASPGSDLVFGVRLERSCNFAYPFAGILHYRYQPSDAGEVLAPPSQKTTLRPQPEVTSRGDKAGAEQGGRYRARLAVPGTCPLA